MQLLSCMCLLWLVPTILARQCGFPGKPEKGAVNPHKSVYNEGELVTYTCDTGFYFKHDSQFLKEGSRTCQDTGLWNGAIPDCAYDDLVVNSSTSGVHPYIIDPWDGTCVHVVLLYQVRIRASFKRNYTGPIQILVGLNRQEGATATVEVDNTNQCSPLISTPRVSEFSCICNITKKEGDHHVELVISPTRENDSYTIICYFKALILTKIGCGEPDCPAYGTVNHTSFNIVTYECEKGYEILGEPERECAWSHRRNKNFWAGTAPVCAPIKTKSNFLIPIANEEMRESPILNMQAASTTLSLVIIAVLATIFNILYCLVRYCRKKLRRASARPPTEVNEEHIYQNQEVRVEPVVLPLKSLPTKDGRNIPDNNGRCSMNENVYAEIKEFPVFSTTQSTSRQTFLNSRPWHNGV